MTVQTNTNVAGFVGNGVTTSFPIGFKFNSSADLIVESTNTTTGITTTLSLNSDYTAQGAGDESGGTITFTTAPSSVETVKVTRRIDLLQLTDLRNQGKFYAEIHEDVFDRLIMIDQQQQTEISDANAKSDDAVATANAADAKADQAVAKADQNLVDMQAQYDAFEQGAALVVIGDYAPGLVVDGYNKIFRKDGEFYRADASLNLPYTLTGDWLAESAKFVSVGDAVLRQELAIASDPAKGAAMVGYMGRNLNERLSEFRLVEDFPGCDPTGIDPSDAAFTAAFEWANGSNRQIIARNSYYIEGSTFYVNCNVDFSASTIQSNGLYEQPIFILGVNKKQVKFGTMVATGTHHLNATHWDKNNCAVAIDPDLPVADNVIEFFRLANYRYGLKLQPGTGADAGFFAYNTVRGAKIEDCEYNLYIDPVGSGWVNQNTFDIRTLRNNSSSVDGWAIYCTKEGIPNSPNGNVFTHIAMEGEGSKCIYWKNSNGTFIAPRFEQRPAGSIQFVGDANYAHATNFIFPDYLDDAMFSYSGTVRRPNIITDKVVRLAGVLEPGLPSLGASTVLSRWGHTPLTSGATPLDAVRMIPGKVQLLNKPASGDQSVLMELDGITGSVARLSFPQSGAALRSKASPTDGAEFVGLIDLYEASLFVGYTGARMTATRNGQMMWDRTLKKPIYWDQDSGVWRDAAGVEV